MPTEHAQGTTASARIELRRGVDVNYWCQVLHVSASELRHAVQQVGPQVAAVHRYLSEHRSSDG
ncbi:MAG: DUF3606 domain-containing protein [Burkholderiales bacterium]|nr:DUF3606 domain-containing protein [Burkholderiales bacterium]MDE1926582.1 DUF3606 domain-containing protein [Burkholderiales bacterium]MDE2159604.1 DUF3606 domain-containing protein [Burkholderiales bacterium]MDE2501383.1 DUF3606 domain-containing protein [Burkholderiales bacterium]